MSWCTDNLSQGFRESIARGCFPVMEKRGHELHGPCPGHKDTRLSFGYDPAKDICSCSAGCLSLSGDLITLWGFTKGYMNRNDAVEAFCKAFGDGSSPVGQHGEVTTCCESQHISEIEWNSLAPLHDIHRDYLRDQFGWTDEIMNEIDFRMEPQGGDGRICIPIRNRDGKLVNIRLWLPEGNGETTISWGKYYDKNRLFPDPSKWAKEKPILICQDEKDCITALAHNFNACTQTIVTGWDKANFNPYFNGKDVVIAYGNDPAGKNLVKKLIDNLTGTARRIRVIQWPGFMFEQSVAGWFGAHKKTVEDFNKLLMSSKNC